MALEDDAVDSALVLPLAVVVDEEEVAAERNVVVAVRVVSAAVGVKNDNCR